VEAYPSKHNIKRGLGGARAQNTLGLRNYSSGIVLDASGRSVELGAQYNVTLAGEEVTVHIPNS
jgi:hypothetical protein